MVAFTLGYGTDTERYRHGGRRGRRRRSRGGRRASSRHHVEPPRRQPPGTIVASGQLHGAAAQVNIRPSAAVAITGDGSYLDDSDGSAVAINNQGTVTFSCTGAVDTDLYVPFNNSGSVVLQQGGIGLGNFGIPSTSTGTFTGAAGTYLAPIEQTLTASSVVSTAGQVEAAYDADAGSFSAAGGTLAISAGFTGPVLGVGPSLEVDGTCTFAPTAGGPVTLTTERR